ncbi:MAG: sucrase ferredoxin [Actinomycetota bacterium]|nr:sucrase ferredoxin [Actinomycetota bacterium]
MVDQRRAPCTLTTRIPAQPVRCAQWARAQQVDPVGTAGSYAGYLLVEWPLPWPRDAGDVEELQAVREAVTGLGLRFQLLVPAASLVRRVTLYRRPEGPFSAFEGREAHIWLRPQDTTAADAAGAGTSAAEAIARATEQLLAGGGEPVRHCDVLVCSHGRRDRCCGSLGTALWKQLSEAAAAGTCDTGTAETAETAGAGAAGVRLARTSHTGGHRFAPTCIVLPAGTLWGFLDADALSRILRRTGPLDDLLPRYRGCSGLGSPGAQALERAVLREVGWPLFDQARSVEDLGAGRLRLSVTGPTGAAAWEATVRPGRMHPVPECGEPLELAKKTETEQRVEDFALVTPAGSSLLAGSRRDRSGRPGDRRGPLG